MFDKLTGKFSFKVLLLTLVAVTFVALTILLIFTSSLSTYNELNRKLHEEGNRLVKGFASSSIVPLLYDSEVNANSVLETLVGIENVTEVSIIRASGTPLLSRTKNNHAPHEYPQTTSGSSVNMLETDKALYFSMRVSASSINPSQNDLLDIANTTNSAESLGVVHIALSKQGILATKNNLLIQNMIASSVIALGLLLVLAVLLGSITKPLEKLALLMEEGKLGKYKANETIIGPAEIRNISRSFNNMIEAITEREQNLTLTLDSLNESIVVTDKDTVITRINPVAARLLGIGQENVAGIKISELFEFSTVDTQNKIASLARSVLHSSDYGSIDEPLFFTNCAGDEFIITVSISAIVDGKTLGLIYVLNDITEKTKQDETLRRTQKLDALGKLTGGIAHDYNNMLHVAMGYAEILRIKSKPAEDSDIDNHITQIIHACQRGQELTQKLLAFSKNTTSSTDIININDMLRAEKDILEKTLTPRIRIVFNLDENIKYICASSSELEDTIINISINAMHAMPDGGELTITTENRYIDEHQAALNNVKSGDFVFITIRDTGCGIPRDIIDNVFDPFFTTKGDVGTGLGLSQVHGFVQRSHGMIKIYSEVHHGTEISLGFPATDYTGSVSNTGTDTQTVKSLSSQGQESILVVDDEPALRLLATEILEQSGYHVMTAENGAAALQLLKSEHIDLVVSDIIMPGIDGYQLHDEIRRYFPNILVQLVSGFTGHRLDRDDHHHDLDILDKPYTASQLLNRVRQLLDGRTDK